MPDRDVPGTSARACAMPTTIPWAQPTCSSGSSGRSPGLGCVRRGGGAGRACRSASSITRRSEEHTSELQSQSNLVCRLLLEKKNKQLKDVDAEDREQQQARE